MAAYHANPVAEKKWSEYRQYISRDIFRKYLDTSADNNMYHLGTADNNTQIKIFS